MKIGVRKPSLKRSIKARTTGRVKRSVKKAIPGYGKKGIGWIKNPKKAAYNKVYHKTTIGVVPSIMGLGKTSNKRKSNKASTTITNDTKAGVQAYNHIGKNDQKRKVWLLIVAILCLIGGFMNIGNSTGAAILGIVLGLAFGTWWFFSKRKRVEENANSIQESAVSVSEDEKTTPELTEEGSESE